MRINARSYLRRQGTFASFVGVSTAETARRLTRFAESDKLLSQCEVIRMEKRRFAGRNFLTWGAILLFVWTGYEFYVRAEMMRWALSGVWRLCLGEGVPFTRALSYFDANMFYLTGFLLVCALYALFALCLRNRPGAGYALIPVGLILSGYAVFGLSVINLGIGNWIQALKFIPLLLIEGGCVVNLVQKSYLTSVARKALGAPRNEVWQDLYLDGEGDKKGASAKELSRRVREMRMDRKCAKEPLIK